MKGKRTSKLVLVLAVLCLIAIGYFAVAQTLEKVSAPGQDVLLVGVNTPFPPFEYRMGENIVGFDIDLTQKIAKSLGKKLVIQDFQDFDALLPALAAGKLDLVVSAVTIRLDRAEVVDFSAPYFTTSQGVLAVKGKVHQISTAQDFEGFTVGYQEGTTSQAWAEENLSGKIEIKGWESFGDFGMGLQLLRVGKIDIILLDKPVAEAFVKQSPDLEVVGEIETGENYGFVVQKGDPKNLLPTINKVLQELRVSGEYEKVIEKWFGGSK